MPVTDFRMFAKYNILTSTEVAERLQVSRQRVSALINSGTLVPIKQTHGTALFFLADVEQYDKTRKAGPMRKLDTVNPPFLRADFGSIRQTEQFVKENIGMMDGVSAIFIYFDRVDAALDHFYLPDQSRRYGDLYGVDIPSMVIRDRGGREMWLYGCNCGYGGGGPSCSARILRYLNVPEDLVEDIFTHRVVELIVDSNGNFDNLCHDSHVSSAYDYDITRNTANLYLRNGQLILVQRREFGSRSLGVLERYRTFIPNPHEVTIFSDWDLPRQKGFVAPGFSSEEIYTVIMRDASGRELWLCPSVLPDIPLEKQNDLAAILEASGFEIPTEGNGNAFQTFISWLNNKPRRLRPEAMHIRR